MRGAFAVLAILVAVPSAGVATALPAVPVIVPHLPTREDAGLRAALEDLGEAFDGWAAFLVEDLATGRYASWNADASFPAASTVKVGVMVESIRRFGFGPGSPIDSDLRQIGMWSSNEAANRLFERVGGVGPTEAALRRLGMFASTYPGLYRKDTDAGDAPDPPPHHHSRATTARDLGRAFFRLQAAAAGQRWALRDTELTAAGARATLGYLALATPATSLLAYPASSTHAEKDGWLDGEVEASAAIAYLQSGPRLVVVLTYRPGLTFGEARALGERVSRLAFS